MSNNLKKNIGVDILRPGVSGLPGVPPTPARCVTESRTEQGVMHVRLIDADGNTAIISVPTAPITVTTTTCYPANPGTPPVPAILPSAVSNFNLGWSGGARSIASLAADGSAKFSVSNNAVGAVVGFDIGAVEFSYAGAEHALFFRKGFVSVVERGVSPTGSVPYSDTDIFSIERVGTVVRYYQDTTLLYTSTTPSYGTQYLEASLYSGGDEVISPSLTTTTAAGYGSGEAIFLPVSARGGNIATSSGNAVLASLSASGTGYVQQGGGAALGPLVATGSQGSYGAGTASLGTLSSQGESTAIIELAIGHAPLGFIISAGLGSTSGNTISPSNSLGDNTVGWVEHVWAGYTVVITAGAGAGQSLEIADNSGQALLLNTEWVTIPDGTSTYEIRDALGNIVFTGVVTPTGGGMRPLSALGADYAYAGGEALLSPITSLGVQAVPLTGWAFIEAPMATLVATAHNSTGENAANITAPTPTVVAYFGSAAKVNAPVPTLVASGTAQNWLTASVVGPAGEVSAAATVSGTSQIVATAPMATLIGYGGMVCSVTLTGRATVRSSATSGGTGAVSIGAPMARLALFEVTTESFSTADILAPAGQMGATLQAWVLAPMATLSAIGSATVTATYEAYAVNLLHPPAARGQAAPVDEATRYTNFPFTHVVRYRNSYYGANATGLYLLEGTTDDGVAIPWAMRTAMTDFRMPTLKTVSSVYVSGRFGPGAELQLHVGEGATSSYSYTTPRGAGAQNYRQAFGKGNKARYYALGMSGSDAVELDGVEFDIHQTTRRI